MAEKEGKKSARLSERKIRAIGTVIICVIALVLLGAMIAVFIIYKDNMLKGLAQSREKAEMHAALDVETIYPGVYIADENVGGLTKEQAKEYLTNVLPARLKSKTIIYRYTPLGYEKEFTFEQLGVGYDYDSAIEEAYSFGRENTDLESRYAQVLENKDRHTYLTIDNIYDSSKVEAAVNEVAKELDREPVNSEYRFENGTFIVTDSASGAKVDTNAAIDTTNSLLPINESADVILNIETVPAEYTREDLSFDMTGIGTYSSAYAGGDENRITNLRIACEKINGSTIMPDETFSTNAALSPFTEANGYKLAGAYVNGELVEDIGGGVCQVSSALYEAALNAELDIVERYNHSKKVGYMDYGYDATLAGDVKDLKIKNNTGKPLYIIANLDGGAVNVGIMGYEIHDSGRKIEFFNKKTGETDSTVTYELYKNVYENGTLTDTVKINKSVYNTK